MDWNVSSYEAFGDLRLRPGLDLLARAPLKAAERVIDLGCGAGALAPALRRRFPGAALVGVDPSKTMLERARATEIYDELEHEDAGHFAADPRGAAPDLIFSNAALHWAPGHMRLLPVLLSLLRPGGALAVQMPRQFDEPSHALLRRVAAALFRGRFEADAPAPVAEPAAYRALLAPRATTLDLWETVYHQPLTAEGDAHPVAAFTASTAARPIFARLEACERLRFEAAYREALEEAYPVEADGRVWFPFRRLFFVATR
ncbi:MAG: methyltransferase domain-containing protein [Pseudomonadota bacterium]